MSIIPLVTAQGAAIKHDEKGNLALKNKVDVDDHQLLVRLLAAAPACEK